MANFKASDFNIWFVCPEKESPISPITDYVKAGICVACLESPTSHYQYARRNKKIQPKPRNYLDLKELGRYQGQTKRSSAEAIACFDLRAIITTTVVSLHPPRHTFTPPLSVRRFEGRLVWRDSVQDYVDHTLHGHARTIALSLLWLGEIEAPVQFFATVWCHISVTCRCFGPNNGQAGKLLLLSKQKVVKTHEKIHCRNLLLHVQKWAVTDIKILMALRC